MSTTILALDIGERKIGVARANKIARISEPLVTLPNDNEFSQELNELIRQHDADTLVVGLPRGLNGQETAQTAYVRDFTAKLNQDIKMVFQDEALTSVNAEEFLKAKKTSYKKEDIDSLAAALILDDYLKENA